MAGIDTRGWIGISILVRGNSQHCFNSEGKWWVNSKFWKNCRWEPQRCYDNLHVLLSPNLENAEVKDE